MLKKNLRSRKERQQPRSAPPRSAPLQLRLPVSPRAVTHTRYLLLNISIQPVPSSKVAKSRSGTRKATSVRKRRKYEVMEKHPKVRKLGAPRRTRLRQRRQQRRRLCFPTAKQPLPPFFLFMAQHRPELQKSNPRWTAVKTVKKLGKMWHKQPEDNKERYKEQAAQLRRKNTQENGAGQGTSHKQAGEELTAGKKISRHKGGNEDFDGLLC